MIIFFRLQRRDADPQDNAWTHDGFGTQIGCSIAFNEWYNLNNTTIAT